MTLMRAILAVPLYFSLAAAAPANALSIAMDFVGTATTKTGAFASEVVPLDVVTGSVIFREGIPFVESNSIADPNDISNRDRLTQFVSPSPLQAPFVGITINYGSLSVSTPTFDPSSSSQIDIRAIDDNPFGADESFFASFREGNGAGFVVRIFSEEFIGLDPSLGFSLALLESFSFASVLPGEADGWVIIPGPHPSGLAPGSLVFDVTDISVREFQEDFQVPLPPTALLMLTGGIALIISRRAARVVSS